MLLLDSLSPLTPSLGGSLISRDYWSSRAIKLFSGRHVHQRRRALPAAAACPRRPLAVAGPPPAAPRLRPPPLHPPRRRPHRRRHGLRSPPPLRLPRIHPPRRRPPDPSPRRLPPRELTPRAPRRPSLRYQRAAPLLGAVSPGRCPHRRRLRLLSWMGAAPRRRPPCPPLPGSPSFPYEHVPSVVRSYVAGDPDWELVREGFLLNSRAWGAVVNSFDEIEGEFLEYLNRFFGHGRVWSVGPVADSGCRGEERSSEAEQLFSWLDTCPSRSVVYVCFGSMYKPPPAQAAALGAALEASGARFVWEVGADAAVVPEGLEERTAARGRVVRGWAPQMEILRHAAVGAFLTHCGWNSTLEGVAAGVPLLAWPMKADQFIDARLVVDLHGAGVRAADGAGAVPYPGALARVFADAADAGKLADVRAKTSELAAAAAAAVEEGGSSWIAMEKMANELETAYLESVDR
ncbi:flavonol 3-O-glucosyltransferase UGT89B1 isoform X3 [Oryza sativa Japonica Group]